MLTYQVRPRKFVFLGSRLPKFPAECVVRFQFLPLQPFGDAADGGRTAVYGAQAEVLFDLNTGEHTIRSSKPFCPIHLDLSFPSGRAEWRGAVFTLAHGFENAADLQNTMITLYHHLPSVLSVVLADPPVIAQVEGEADSVPFRWELRNWRMVFSPRTEAQQSALIAGTWRWLELAVEPYRGRLLAALQYFHKARRLARLGSTPGEFMAEGLLNLTKVLEVLFPPAAGGSKKTRDAIREGLRALGYTEAECDARFLPAVALRNELDVGHVSLAILTEDQLRVVHAYTDAADAWFGELLERLLQRVQAGRAEVVPYEQQPPKAEVLQIIERLRANLPQEALGEE